MQQLPNYLMKLFCRRVPSALCVFELCTQAPCTSERELEIEAIGNFRKVALVREGDDRMPVLAQNGACMLFEN